VRMIITPLSRADQAASTTIRALKAARTPFPPPSLPTSPKQPLPLKEYNYGIHVYYSSLCLIKFKMNRIHICISKLIYYKIYLIMNLMIFIL
jgi:hypothetical protein